MPATPPATWSALDDGIAGSGSHNGDPPRALTLRRVADGANHIAIQGRVLFSQSIALADSPSANGTTNLFRYRYFQRNNNGKRLRYAIWRVPKDQALNDNSAVLNDVDEGPPTTTVLETIRSRFPLADITYPSSARTPNAIVTVAPSGAENSRRIDVVDGYRLVAITVFETEDDGWPLQLTGTDHHADPSDFMPGLPITSARLVDLRETQEEIFQRIRDVYNYCAHGFTSSDGYSLTDVTTFTNFLDATTARTANTGGIPVSALLGAKGFGTTVNAHCAVYAERTGAGGSTGEVRFVSSVNSATVAGIGAAGWYTVGNTLQIDTRAVNADGRDWDKVDVQGRVTTAVGGPNTVRVWAWHVEIEP